MDYEVVYRDWAARQLKKISLQNKNMAILILEFCRHMEGEKHPLTFMSENMRFHEVPIKFDEVTSVSIVYEVVKNPKPTIIIFNLEINRA